MIHHLARALAIRETRPTGQPASPAPATPPNTPLGRTVRPLPLAVPRAPSRPAVNAQQHRQGLRIHRDPSDARRTVIAGRFAEVCAALERLAAEPEAA